MALDVRCSGTNIHKFKEFWSQNTKKNLSKIFTDYGRSKTNKNMTLFAPWSWGGATSPGRRTVIWVQIRGTDKDKDTQTKEQIKTKRSIHRHIETQRHTYKDTRLGWRIFSCWSHMVQPFSGNFSPWLNSFWSILRKTFLLTFWNPEWVCLIKEYFRWAHAILWLIFQFTLLQLFLALLPRTQPYN